MPDPRAHDPSGSIAGIRKRIVPSPFSAIAGSRP
jgi:hypothetical protein